MEPISRRSALTLGGVGAAFVLAGGAGLVSVLSTRPGTPSLSPTGAELAQPQVIRSADGALDVALTAGPSAVDIGGTTVNALTYNPWVNP